MAGWKQQTLALLQKETSLPRLEAILARQFDALFAQIDAVPEITALRKAAFDKQRAYISAQNKLLAEKLYRKAFTVDYLHERPTGQPELHQVRAVFSTPVGRKPADSTVPQAPPGAFTVNAGLSVFRPELMPGDGWKTRDSQVSAALDWTPIRSGVLRPTYTFAYYFQYMAANGVIKFDKTAITPGGAAIPLPKPAIEVLNTKGAIHVAPVPRQHPRCPGDLVPAGRQLLEPDGADHRPVVLAGTRRRGLRPGTAEAAADWKVDRAECPQIQRGLRFAVAVAQAAA